MRYRKKYWMIGMDPQQLPPAGWCPVCKQEIWEDGENLCPRCKKLEEENEQCDEQY